MVGIFEDMAITKLTVEEFLSLAAHHPVIDVRSPGEFSHAHIPNAFSMPLFTDEERKIVGTAYKQESKQKAIKIGLKYFGTKMVKMVERTEEIIQSNAANNQDLSSEKPIVLVHCWRGGMRSAGVAWMLDLYGFKVYTLVGGYKAYRNWVLQQFEVAYPIHILGGNTGSGKTEVLQEMRKMGAIVIDLEGIAHHKGSAFGSMGQLPQPSQEQFENILAAQLSQQPFTDKILWIEDESQRIGDVNIPPAFFKQMRETKVYFVQIPFEERLAFITTHYGKFEKEQLINAIVRIKKRLGGLETKTAVNALIEDDVKGCFDVLLKYYDRVYQKGLMKRDHIDTMVEHVVCDTVDATLNAKKLLGL
jgi:tRNA 2-selenouridine synthase